MLREYKVTLWLTVEEDELDKTDDTPDDNKSSAWEDQIANTLDNLVSLEISDETDMSRLIVELNEVRAERLDEVSP